MGTRNLVKVIDRNGVLRVAQYGQFDGYPSGQGVTALAHLRYNSASEIERGLDRVRWATQDELDTIRESLPTLNLIGTDDCKKFDLLYPNLNRQTGAEILAVVAFSVGEVILVNSADFETSDACEAVYTVDLQRRLFISKYDGHEVEFSLDNLPEKDDYLKAWELIYA